MSNVPISPEQPRPEFEMRFYRREKGEATEYWEVEVYRGGALVGDGTAPTLEGVEDLADRILRPPMQVLIP